MSDILGPIFLFFVLAVLLFSGAAYLDYVGCHSKWRDSGMPVRWGLISGCQIQVDKRWIPAENYREL